VNVVGHNIGVQPRLSDALYGRLLAGLEPGADLY
jgi:hypothetical protein